MEEYITRRVFEEFEKRVEAEESRQNHRIDRLEHIMETTQELTVSVKTMAVSIENMTAEIKKQGDRLEKLEAEPGNKWRRLMDGIIGAVAGLVGSGLIYAIIQSI